MTIPDARDDERTGRRSAHEHYVHQHWFRRYEFLWAMLALLVLYAVFLLPNTRKPSTAQWGLIAVFFLGLLAWVGTLTTDDEKPTWMGALAAVVLLLVFSWLFYRYSGAQWSKLTFVFLNKAVMEGEWGPLSEGLLVTLEIAILSAILGVLTGLILAVLRSLNNWMLNLIIIAYVDVIRATPLIVLLVVVYYALPYVGILLSAVMSGVLALTLNCSAYTSEIFRAGIESIHGGQVEAARSLGLSPMKTMRLVILPQAFRVVVPPLTSTLVGLLKDTAVCSVASIVELLRAALQIQAWKANPTPLIAATIIYLLILIPLTRLSNRLEVRMKAGFGARR
jgi:polar amino acid transport system permease protein